MPGSAKAILWQTVAGRRRAAGTAAALRSYGWLTNWLVQLGSQPQVSLDTVNAPFQRLDLIAVLRRTITEGVLEIADELLGNDIEVPPGLFCLPSYFLLQLFDGSSQRSQVRFDQRHVGF